MSEQKRMTGGEILDAAFEAELKRLQKCRRQAALGKERPEKRKGQRPDFHGLKVIQGGRK